MYKRQDVWCASPLYDWSNSDVWYANYRFDYDYNNLYDLYYKAGLKIDQMRVASPFNDYSKDGLNLYRVIDPEIWTKLVGRVRGANLDVYKRQVLSCVRKTDAVIRYGGDEFVIIFFSIPANIFEKKLERIRYSVDSLIIDGHPELHMTVSIGGVYGRCV